MTSFTSTHKAPSIEAKATREPAKKEETMMNMSQVLTHRLSSFVNIIEGYADLLTDTLHTSEQRDMALRIFESAAGIDRILSDLKRYSQPIQPVFRRCSVKTVVEGGLAALTLEKADRVAVTFARNEQEFVADPMLLRQALLIMLQNALDATESHAAVELTVSITDEGACFAVCNAGSMDIENPCEKVFEPFFTTKAHNLGVGLSLARSIAEEHQGALQLAESNDEAGTRFVLKLPPLEPSS